MKPEKSASMTRAPVSKEAETFRPRTTRKSTDGDVRAPAFELPRTPDFANADLFCDLAANQFEVLEKIAVQRRLRRGQYLFRRGAPSPGLVYVARGCVSLRRLQADGSEFVIRTFRAGETFAEATLVPDGRAPADARAESECLVRIFPRQRLLETLGADPQLALHLIASLSRRIHQLVETSEARAALSPRERVLDWLAARLPRDGVVTCSVSPGVPLSTLAAELGMRPETLSRQLARLAGEGLITRFGRRIDIPDVGGIRRALDCDRKGT